MTDIDGAAERLRNAIDDRLNSLGENVRVFDPATQLERYEMLVGGVWLSDLEALLADRARLLSRNAELERALEPIARVGRAMIQPLPDDDRMFTVLPAGDGPGVALYRGDLRAAARVLTKES